VAAGGAIGGGVGWDEGVNGFSLGSMRRTLLTVTEAGKRVSGSTAQAACIEMRPLERAGKNALE
jgi:hypothetical protein